MENVIHSRRDRRQKDAFHPLESTIEVVSREAVNGDLRAIESQGTHTGAVVKFAGHKLHNNGTGRYTFAPSAGKRFIEQGFKVLPDFITGIHSRITILDSAGSFEVAVHNFSGSTISITLQAVETDFWGGPEEGHYRPLPDARCE